MPDDGVNRSITNALLDGDVGAQIERKRQEITKTLKARIADYRAALVELTSSAEGDDRSDELGMSAAEGDAEMDNLASDAASELTTLKHEKRQARRYEAAFIKTHNIPRPLSTPNPYESAAILGLAVAAEGAALSSFLVAGGMSPSIPAALMQGCSIAAINVGLSAGLGGYLCGRYFNYGTGCDRPPPVVPAKRWAARAGALVVTMLIALLHMSAALVRSTGSTTDLALNAGALAACFTDFNSLLLILLNSVISVFAWRKGIVGFSDPYPGFEEAASQVAGVEADAKDVFETASDDIAVVYEDISADLTEKKRTAIEAAAARANKSVELGKLREQILSSINAANDEFQAYVAEVCNEHAIISGENRPPTCSTMLDIVALSSLLAEAPQTSIPGTVCRDAYRKASEALLKARKSATERVRAAYAAFLNPKGDL